jgi:hypothetical protein
MIYANHARAQQIANMLNASPGSLESRPVLTAHGWTVITKAVWAI